MREVKETGSGDNQLTSRTTETPQKMLKMTGETGEITQGTLRLTDWIKKMARGKLRGSDSRHLVTNIRLIADLTQQIASLPLLIYINFSLKKEWKPMLLDVVTPLVIPTIKLFRLFASRQCW